MYITEDILNRIKELQIEYEKLNIFVDVTITIQDSVRLYALSNRDNKYEPMYLDQENPDLNWNDDFNKQDIINEQICNQIKNHREEFQKRINEFNKNVYYLQKK